MTNVDKDYIVLYVISIEAALLDVVMIIPTQHALDIEHTKCIKKLWQTGSSQSPLRGSESIYTYVGKRTTVQLHSLASLLTLPFAI